MRTVETALRRRLTVPPDTRTDQDSIDTVTRLNALVGILLFADSADRPGTPSAARRKEAAERVWMHIARADPPTPQIVIARVDPASIEHNAGRPGPRFDTLRYEVAAIDVGPNPARALEVEAAVLELLDAAPLFANPEDDDPPDHPDVDDPYPDETEGGLQLLDVRPVARIQRVEILEQPQGAIIWYRGVVLQVETESC